LAEQKMGFWGLFFSRAPPDQMLSEKLRIPVLDKGMLLTWIFELKRNRNERKKVKD